MQWGCMSSLLEYYGINPWRWTVRSLRESFKITITYFRKKRELLKQMLSFSWLTQLLKVVKSMKIWIINKQEPQICDSCLLLYRLEEWIIKHDMKKNFRIDHCPIINPVNSFNYFQAIILLSSQNAIFKFSIIIMM